MLGRRRVIIVDFIVILIVIRVLYLHHFRRKLLVSLVHSFPFLLCISTDFERGYSRGPPLLLHTVSLWALLPTNVYNINRRR